MDPNGRGSDGLCKFHNSFLSYPYGILSSPCDISIAITRGWARQLHTCNVWPGHRPVRNPVHGKLALLNSSSRAPISGRSAADEWASLLSGRVIALIFRVLSLWKSTCGEIRDIQVGRRSLQVPHQLVVDTPAHDQPSSFFGLMVSRRCWPHHAAVHRCAHSSPRPACYGLPLMQLSPGRVRQPAQTRRTAAQRVVSGPTIINFSRPFAGHRSGGRPARHGAFGTARPFSPRHGFTVAGRGGSCTTLAAQSWSSAHDRFNNSDGQSLRKSYQGEVPYDAPGTVIRPMAYMCKRISLSLSLSLVHTHTHTHTHMCHGISGG